MLLRGKFDRVLTGKKREEKKKVDLPTLPDPLCLVKGIPMFGRSLGMSLHVKH